MSEIKNRKRLTPEYTPAKKFFFAILWFPIAIITPLWLMYMGLRLRPVKFKWVLMGFAAFVVEFVAFYCMSHYVLDVNIAFPLFLLPSLLLVIYVFKTRAYEEYVMSYNALVDSGYFVEQERIKAANLQRWEDETALKARERAEALTYQPKGVAVPRPRTAAIDAETVILEEQQEAIALDEVESAPAGDEPQAAPAADKPETAPAADDGVYPAPGGRKLDL